MPKSKQSWAGSQLPPTRLNMRAGRWSSVDCSTSKQKSNKSPCWFVVQKIGAFYCGEVHFWNRLLWMVKNVAIDGAKFFQSCCNMLRLLVQCVALTDISRLRQRKGGWRGGPPWGKDSCDMISIEEPNPALLSLPRSALPTSRPLAPSHAGMINICLEHHSSILGRSKVRVQDKYSKSVKYKYLKSFPNNNVQKFL